MYLQIFYTQNYIVFKTRNLGFIIKLFLKFREFQPVFLRNKMFANFKNVKQADEDISTGILHLSNSKLHAVCKETLRTSTSACRVRQEIESIE